MSYFIKSTKGEKVLVLGPYPSEMQAQLRADDLDREYDIIFLETNDLGKATGIVKERMIKEKGLDKATQNISHKI